MSDEESTHEIEIDALRDSLVAARRKSLESPDADPDRTVVAPPIAGRGARRRGDSDSTAVTRMLAPAEPIPDSSQAETFDALQDLVAARPPRSFDSALPPDRGSTADIDDVEDVEDDDGVATAHRHPIVQDDDEDVDELLPTPYRQTIPRAADEEDAPFFREPLPTSTSEAPFSSAHDPTPSLIGTVPGHDVAQALRAMMGDVPDFAASVLGGDVSPNSEATRAFVHPASTSLEDGDTQTRLPGDAPLSAPDEPAKEEGAALPSFALLDDDEDLGASTADAIDRWPPPNDVVPQPLLPDNPLSRREAPSAEGWGTDDERTAFVVERDHGRLRRPSRPDTEAPPTAAEVRLGSSSAEVVLPAHELTAASFVDPEELPLPSVPPPITEPHEEALPRFSLASFADLGPETEAPAPRSEPAMSIAFFRGMTADNDAANVTSSTLPETDDPIDDPESAPLSSLDPELVSIPPARLASSPDLFVGDVAPTSAPIPSPRISTPSLDTTAPDGLEPIHVVDSLAISVMTIDSSEADIVEILDDELVEEVQTNSGAPPVHHPPFHAPAVVAVTAAALDAEEAALWAERRFEELITLYRARLATTEGPNRKAALLVKIARVHEEGEDDVNEAFQTLAEAFEIAPGNEEVITAIDRVGKASGRIGELADKVKKRLLPNADGDKRVLFLGHLVYWYERVLGRGNEVSPLVSDIERHDKVHPVVLKRSAMFAAMNADTKTQREHLHRALERTVRREEKVAIYLQLASAYAGTPEALKLYETTLELDPTSLVAIQAIKRIGKEKENHAQVKWALERQADVAPTEAERIDAYLELAELQETRFLKREEAADLLEQVLVLEPAHPTALKGLERCYHALRDWPKLAMILGVRSEHTFDKKAKVELLERAAEVHESKLGDPAGAIEVYRNLLVVDPKHRRALGDLARLYEKLDDWSNVATYKARLTELAPTKRLASQELVKLGDFLSAPDRDPIAAKLQYERAAVVDPTNAGAWEALQKVAAEAGDDRRVIECLEQRKTHTEVPRQRAAVLVELARVHLDQGDDESAKECFEAAIRADSSNELAAVAMLDAYTAEERWQEAAPLCELLVNAAIRDHDGDALFVRLRLATRIAAALGDAERSVTSAMAALDARPDDLGAQADLVAVCSQSPATAVRATAHLAKIAEHAGELGVDMTMRLARLRRDAADLDGAAALFERVRRTDPDDRDVAKELAEIYLEQGDFPRASKLKLDLARTAPSADARFELFVEAGEIWARRAGEHEKAASIFEEARLIRPRDPWLLQTLMWLYGELSEWETLAGVLADMADVQEKPEDKAKLLLSLSEIVKDKLADPLRAADLYDQVLDLEKARLDVFQELVRTLTEMKNWERLERSYRKMIARVKDDGETQLQFLLFHQLGLIYRDRLGDASRAYDALDAASRLRPEDAAVRKIVIELLVVTDNLDNAVARLRDEIERDPHDAQLYAELYELFLRQHFFDKAWCTVNVLAHLGAPSAEQKRFHADYAPMPLDQIPGQIVDQAWRSHVFHADLDPALTDLFALLTPVVARLRFGQLRPEQRVGRPFTPTHSRMHEAIRATFNNASEILAVEPPELLLGDAKLGTPFSPALAPYGAILVCVPAIEGRTSSLVYTVGKHLAEQRPELAARAFFPSVTDLGSLLGTAMRVSRNEGAKDPASAALDASFAQTLSPQERDGIRSIVLAATSAGAALDVQRWSQAADLSSMRAGLLLSGDVAPAREAIEADLSAPSDLSTREKIGELYKFATSDLYSDLRGAIGVAVQD